MTITLKRWLARAILLSLIAGCGWLAWQVWLVAAESLCILFLYVMIVIGCHNRDAKLR